MEIPAAALPRSLAVALFRVGSSASVTQRTQLWREIDQLIGNHMDDETVTLDLAAHFQELRRHDSHRRCVLCEHGFGDEMNGFRFAKVRGRTLADCAMELGRQACAIYPESKFAERYLAATQRQS